MKVTAITISKGMTVNLGNFNSHRVDVGYTVAFDETDDVSKGVEQITALVNQRLAKEVNEFTGKKQTLMEGQN